MLNQNHFVLGIAVILLTGLLFGKIAKKLHIPNITGYLVGGVIIGPMLLGIIFGWFNVDFSGILGEKLVDSLELIVDIELGFIAFTVGCEFKVSYFKQVGAMPVIIAFAESFAAVIFITGGMMLIPGVPVYFALCMGAVGGATAPAATIMVIRQYKAKGPLAKTLLSVVAIDDASALIFFGVAIAIVKSIVSPGADITMSIVMPFIEILTSLALGIIIGFLLTLLMRFFKSGSNRLVLTIALIFVNIGICILLNETFNTSFSSLLACMAAGAVFCNTSKITDDVMPLVENITPPLVVIFFIISGASLNLEALSLTAIGLLAVYLVFRVAGKVLGTVVSAKVSKAPPVVKKWLGFGLLPQGGIAIGLSMLVMQTLDGAPNLEGSFDGQLVRVIVLCAVFVSEIFGPILCKMALIKSGEGQVEKSVKKNRLAAAGAPLPPDSGVMAESSVAAAEVAATGQEVSEASPADEKTDN